MSIGLCWSAKFWQHCKGGWAHIALTHRKVLYKKVWVLYKCTAASWLCLFAFTLGLLNRGWTLHGGWTDVASHEASMHMLASPG